MPAIKTTWHHVRRSPYQAFAAIFITFQTFFIISIFTFVIYSSAKIITYFESLPQVTAFFKNEATSTDITNLQNELKKTGKVSNIKFVSKEEALKIYRNQNKDDPLLLDLVTADILPASLEISAVSINDLSSISDTLSRASSVQEVIFPKDIVSNLSAWTGALRKIGIILTGILAIDAIFIMVIIIGIKISQRREEIEIMRLLGATSWYIRWPFMLEGVWYGISGAVIGYGISLGVLWYATPFLSSFMKGIPIFPLSPVFLAQVLGIEIAIAILLGMIGSSLAVFRYLK